MEDDGEELKKTNQNLGCISGLLMVGILLLVIIAIKDTVWFRDMTSKPFQEFRQGFEEGMKAK